MVSFKQIKWIWWRHRGSTSFDITPTSLGDIVTAYAEVVVRDELGEPSYDKNGKLKKKRIECVIRDII